MSGNTSETRCVYLGCDREEKHWSHTVYEDKPIHIDNHPFQAPPEGEAVPDQVKLKQNLSFLEAAPEEVARMNAAIADKYMLYAAPVVSTAAPAGPEVVLSQGNASGCTAATTWAIGSNLTEVPAQPPCSECATPSSPMHLNAEQLRGIRNKIAEGDAGMYEAALLLQHIDSIPDEFYRAKWNEEQLTGLVEQQKSICATLRKERDDAKWVASAKVELRGAGVDESPHCYKRLPEVLAEHGDSIKILHTLTPIGVAMAGEREFDPYKD